MSIKDQTLFLKNRVYECVDDNKSGRFDIFNVENGVDISRSIILKGTMFLVVSNVSLVKGIFTFNPNKKLYKCKIIGANKEFVGWLRMWDDELKQKPEQFGFKEINCVNNLKSQERGTTMKT